MKIYIDEATGSAYKLEGEEVAFAPLSTDGTFDFEEGGIVEVWSEDGAEKALEEEKRIRAKLA